MMKRYFHRRLVVVCCAASMLAACGSSTAHRATLAPSTGASKVAGFLLSSADVHVLSVQSGRASTPIAGGIELHSYRHNDGATLGIVEERSIAELEGSTRDTTEVDEAHCQLNLRTTHARFTMTGSDLPGCADRLDRLAAALEAASGPEQLDEVVTRTDAGWRPSTATPRPFVGYAVNYEVGQATVTLAVLAADPATDLLLTDQFAAQAFVHHDARGEFVLLSSFDGEPSELRWVDSGYVVSVIGAVDLIARLREDVVSVSTDPVAAAMQAMAVDIARSETTDAATVDGLTLTRHTGAPGTQGAVCVGSSGPPTCSYFQAVGSFASMAVDGRWLIVAVTPATKPTTTFETKPALDFTEAIGAKWKFAVAVVGEMVSSVEISYATDGVTNPLSTTFNRPMSGG